jgi:hypothetical protein
MSSEGSAALEGKAIFYMCLLALQFGMQPTLTRRYTPGGICRSTVILMQEILKFVLAYTMLNISGSKKSALAGKESFVGTSMYDSTVPRNPNNPPS